MLPAAMLVFHPDPFIAMKKIDDYAAKYKHKTSTGPTPEAADS
jgi:hypothetical protein